MSKPTSGPWSVEIIKGSYQRPALVVAGDKLVAQCMGNQLDPSATSIGEATANAHLIAAAPDLYELGLAVLEIWDSGDFFVESSSGQEDILARGMERLKAALAKARAGI